MYSLSQVRRGVRRGVTNPAFFGRELNRLYHRRLSRREFNPSGIDIPAADWDNLIILDACRYDVFEEQHDLPGDLYRRQSRGSHTVEFLTANFSGRELLDTVYVTASPQLVRWQEQIGARFHEVINVWEEDGWDETHHTVMPGTMVEFTRRAADRFPNKRLVIHFIQPHYPFLRSGAELNTNRLRDPDGAKADIWELLMRNDLRISTDRIWTAYRENLDAVLPSAADLLDELDGRTVVTSDHGNMLGDRAYPIPIREWGHPPGIYTDQLVTVPWLVSENGTRRDVVEEPPTSRAGSVAEDEVTDRLEQLGYVE